MKSKSCVVIAALFVCGALAPIESAACLDAVDPLQQQGHHYLEGINLNTLTTTAKPVVTLSATSLGFSCLIQSIPAYCVRYKSVRLKNSGNAVLRITSIVNRGLYSPGDLFSVHNNCGSILRPGMSCTIYVHWFGSDEQFSWGTITITDNAADSPQKVKLKALGK